jgi:hypothetical protein
MRIVGAILLLVVLLGMLLGSASGDELEDYIAHVREVRMSARAEMQVSAMASILAGYLVLTYERDAESGRYWPSLSFESRAASDAEIEHFRREAEARYTRMAELLHGVQPREEAEGSWSVANAETELLRREAEARDTRMAELLKGLHPLADADGSGFVTDEEGSQFRHQVEVGFLATQLDAEGPLTLQRVSEALGVDEVESLYRLDGYAIMYPTFVDLGVAFDLSGFGAPPLPKLQF